jgi:hypothetical protein
LRDLHPIFLLGSVFRKWVVCGIVEQRRRTAGKLQRLEPAADVGEDLPDCGRLRIDIRGCNAILESNLAKWDLYG